MENEELNNTLENLESETANTDLEVMDSPISNEAIDAVESTVGAGNLIDDTTENVIDSEKEEAKW